MGEYKGKDPAKILIVDDLEMNVSILASIIEAEGYEALCALNVKEALDIMNDTMPQLILSDWYMPEMSGLEFCRLLKENPKTRDIPFLFITVADSGEDKKQAFEAGAVDYIPKPFERIEVVMRVNNQLNSYRAKQEIEKNNRMMHQVIADQKKLMLSEQENLLVALSKVLVRRRQETGVHLDCVSYNARILAESLQLSAEYEKEISDEFVEAIATAARLHDIGSLVMSDKQVDEGKIRKLKPGSEYNKIHSEEGAALLEEIASHSSMSYFLEMAHQIAKYHHANWDGTGYPEGVGGTDIPLAARIVAVVNDFDIVVRSLYGRANPAETAALRIMEGSGTLYEPFITEVFLKIIKQLKIIL